jgi:hypothetical protein
MIDFNALLNAAFEQAIEAKVAPLRAQLQALECGTAGVTWLKDGEEQLKPAIQTLVDARCEHFIEEHNEAWDHDDFVTETDFKDKIDDILDDLFQSKFEAALDGTRVTLNT